MRQHHSARRLTHANRRIAAAVVLLGLLLQALSPYLPMPAMGGGTSWDVAVSGGVAWLPTCLSPRDDADAGRSSSGSPHPGDCAVCLVMQQAGATLAPASFEMPVPVAFLRAAPAPWQQVPGGSPPADGFSSRAPPHFA
mgnify:FL=1